jgi:hypothetical protein
MYQGTLLPCWLWSTMGLLVTGLRGLRVGGCLPFRR